jgi:hypothetical protein
MFKNVEWSIRMSDPNKNFSKNQSLSEVSKKVAYEKLTRSLLRKIRENDAADKKENLKNKFKELLLKENF